MRSAPRNGYDFGNKRQYRRNVWRTFADSCPVPRAEAKVLMMPSLEGDEIDVAIAAGFREKNIIVVDRNPAIVATLKRRYRNIQTVGVDLSRVHERIEPESIHLANFDLCSQLSNPLLNTVWSASSVLARDSISAVTMLRGRESNLPAWKEFYAVAMQQFRETNKGNHAMVDESASESDQVRAAVVGACMGASLDRHCTLIRQFSYRSTTVTMLAAFYWTHDRPRQPEIYDLASVRDGMRRLARIVQMNSVCARYGQSDNVGMDPVEARQTLAAMQKAERLILLNGPFTLSQDGTVQYLNLRNVR